MAVSSSNMSILCGWNFVIQFPDQAGPCTALSAPYGHCDASLEGILWRIFPGLTSCTCSGPSYSLFFQHVILLFVICFGLNVLDLPTFPAPDFAWMPKAYNLGSVLINSGTWTTTKARVLSFGSAWAERHCSSLYITAVPHRIAQRIFEDGG